MNTKKLIEAIEACELEPCESHKRLLIPGVFEHEENSNVFLQIRDYGPDGEMRKYEDACKYAKEQGIPEEKRLVIVAYNEGGWNCTAVDFLQLLKWVKENCPEILEEI
jgi:hypothetical protein